MFSASTLASSRRRSEDRSAGSGRIHVDRGGKHPRITSKENPQFVHLWGPRKKLEETSGSGLWPCSGIRNRIRMDRARKHP